MKKNKRKINWGWITYPSVGLIIGGVAAVTYISITKLMGSDPEVRKLKISEGKSTWFDFNGKEIENPNNNELNKGIKFKVVENNSKYSFIHDDVLKMVAKKFMERGIFGPELGSLKTISFDDKNLISKKNVNGIYIPSTKEIGINTETINSALLKYYNDIWAPNFHCFFNEIKSEAIFQVLYHEYGHHIFSSYVESPYTGNAKTIYEKIFDEKKQEWKVSENKWNDLFLKKFMNLFLYDNAKVAPIDSRWPYLQTEKNKTVGYKFSAHDLFNEININKNLPNKSTVDWNIEYLNLSSQLINDFKRKGVDLDNYKMSIKNEYSYLYSAEELVTRKLLLASAPFSFEAFKASNYVGFFPYDLIHDLLNFASKSTNDSFDWNRNPPMAIFMHDYVFSKNDNRAENYMKLLDEAMGHKENNNISLIWNMNNALVANNNQIIDKYHNPSNPNKIKFGGYTDKKYNYVGYMDGDKFVPFKIKTYKYKIGYKDSVLSGFQDTIAKDLRKKIKYYKRDALGNVLINNDTGEELEDKSLGRLPYSYYLEPWVDANNIENQVLYFADDAKGTNKIPLSGIRSNEQGGTTSFSKWSRFKIGEDNTRIWKAKYDKEPKDNEQGLMITFGGLFKDGVSKIQR